MRRRERLEAGGGSKIVGQRPSGSENISQVFKRKTEEFFDNIEEYAQEEVDELEETIFYGHDSSDHRTVRRRGKNIKKLEAQALGVYGQGRCKMVS